MKPRGTENGRKKKTISLSLKSAKFGSGSGGFWFLVSDQSRRWMLATELATSVCGYSGCDGVVCGSSSSINQVNCLHPFSFFRFFFLVNLIFSYVKNVFFLIFNLNSGFDKKGHDLFNHILCFFPCLPSGLIYNLTLSFLFPLFNLRDSFICFS